MPVVRPGRTRRRESEKLKTDLKTQDVMAPEVPQLVPGPPPTVLPERLRVHLKHFGTNVRYPNLVLDALVGSADHSGGQIWCRTLIFLVPVSELSREKPRT